MLEEARQSNVWQESLRQVLNMASVQLEKGIMPCWVVVEICPFVSRRRDSETPAAILQDAKWGIQGVKPHSRRLFNVQQRFHTALALGTARKWYPFGVHSPALCLFGSSITALGNSEVIWR
jgi:hypothetical protein